jgi:formate dehydrogenase major subunit
MTNGWVDIKNADLILVMGGNPAENHPCGFKWAIEAKRTRNAKIISVDPRFTRTSSVADLYCHIRAGTDIAFLGGMIRYAIENGRYPHDYLVNYTNAAFIIKDGFKLPEDGLYSGFDAATQTYDRSTWNYQEGGDMSGKHDNGAAAKADPPQAASKAGTPAPPPSLPANVAYDLTLQHPRCVFQLLRQQYSRYTPEMVERITGAKKEDFLKVADLYTSIRINGDTKKVGTMLYALGWTQHSYGTQMIRTAAMLQLILGNVGRAGGGVNALRGHSNIQGATDMAGIFEILPGYLKVPTPADTDYAAWIKRITPTSSKPQPWESFNYWSNTPKFAVSFLKTLYGDAATKENGWAFDYLPKVDRNYSWVNIWDDMYKGNVKGMLAFGMNGVAVGPDTNKNIAALKKADFLVVGEIYPDETSSFWQAPGTTPEEMKSINTTVYRLPCAGFAEKDGSMVNSARWLQWKNAALPPPGNARLDQDIIAQIFLKVREMYQKEGGKFPDPILKLTWPYTDPKHPALAEVTKEFNGKTLVDATDPTGSGAQLKAGQQLPGFAWLKDDGTTTSGNWLYCGCYTEAGNLTQRRNPDDPSGLGIHANWAWSWPANRRVMYNRASCTPDGKPWDPERRQIWWNEASQKWVGNDVPDFKVDSKPQDHMGPFIMNPDGVGRLFGPLASFAEGPFPEHYEPTESPVQNPLHPAHSTNPVVKRYSTPLDKYGTADQFPIVCTTYRLTEHYHYWTKNNPMNVQLIPEPFVEMSYELADQLGIKGAEKIKVTSARGEYIAKALVTHRLKPLQVDGKTVYQVGIPIHQGYRGIQEDAHRDARTPVNLLSPTVIDPNAYTPEFKAFLVKVEKYSG